MRSTLYPTLNDITMVTPTKITDSSIYVKLLEYNDIEGLIILSDLSKSRMRSINKVVQIGKKFPACVQSIDINTNNITLSKKTVTQAEIITYTNNHITWKRIRDIMILFIDKMKKEYDISTDIQIMYHRYIWSLGDEPDTLFAALKSAANDFFSVYDSDSFDINDTSVICFQTILKQKFKAKDTFLEAVMEISCFETNGINVIKNSLIMAIGMATKEYPFEVKLIKSPYYSITLKTNDPNGAIALINQVVETVKQDLIKNKANFKIIKMPEILTEQEFEPEKSDSMND
jgi:translation initiation factor 2 subunit 1